jgi:hypothetical protein
MQISSTSFLSLRYPECFLQLPSQIEGVELTGTAGGRTRLMHKEGYIYLISFLPHSILLSRSVDLVSYAHHSIIFNLICKTGGTIQRLLSSDKKITTHIIVMYCKSRRILSETHCSSVITCKKKIKLYL